MSPPALPRWARAADFLSFLLVVIALTVSASGGFRIRIGALRLALTSPLRLLIWAIVIGVARHFAAPQQPVYRDLPRRIARWARSVEVRTAAAVVVGTRPAVLFVGYLAIMLFGYVDGSPAHKMPLHDYDSEVFNLQLRWDTGWYHGIAMNGYSYDPQTGPSGQQDPVFFPAYPLIMRVAGLLFGNRELSYILGGTVVSLLSFLLALTYLYRLARELLDDDQSVTALWLLAAYPFAIFYSAIYTESLYLLGAVGAFYHFRRRELAQAGAWGLLVGLTRPNGFALSLPLALLAIEPWLPPYLVGGAAAKAGAVKPARTERLTMFAPVLAAAAMPVVGMLLYSAFVWWLTGHPFTWAAGHAAWGRHYQGLSRVVMDRYYFIWSAGFSGYVAQLPVDLLNGLGALFALVTAWPIARRLGLAYAVFVLVNILPQLAAGGLMSVGRFSSVLFPVFIWLAAAIPPRHRMGWVVTFAAIQALNAAMFYTWRPLY